MKNTLKQLICLVVLALFSLLSFVSARPLRAQDTTVSTLINYAESADSGDGLGLNLYFTFLGNDGSVATTAQPGTANVVLEDGSRYTVQVKQADTPFYIVLALDTSGSMFSVSKEMLAAAEQAVSVAPVQVYFRLVTFADKATVLQDFTYDHNKIIAALRLIKIPTLTTGTCIFDTLMSSLDAFTKTDAARTGRRAMILFTDGKDELASNGKPCSKASEQDVVSKASLPELRVPIHTIALTGKLGDAVDQRLHNPNTLELGALAEYTGGLSAFGSKTDLNKMFGKIADAIKNQYVATTIIHPTQGVHTLSMFATLVDKNLAKPGSTTIKANRDYSQGSSSAPGSAPAVAPDVSAGTPIPASLHIDSIQADTGTHTLSVNVTSNGDVPATEFRFQFKDTATNLLKGEYSLPAPLVNPVKLPVDTLLSGQYVLTISALAKDGRIIARSEDEKFVYQLPTVTPPPISNTPAPIGATLNNIAYDDVNRKLQLALALRGGDQLGTLRIEFVNTRTNLLTQTYNTAPAETVTLGVDNLPAAEYHVTVVSLNTSGQELSRASRDFVFAPPTATPTETVTPTLTLTPLPTTTGTGTAVVAVLTIQQVLPDSQTQELVIKIQSQNPGLISSYRLDFVDATTNLVKQTFSYKALTDNALRVSLSKIDAGKYNLVVTALGSAGQELTNVSINITYNPPTVAPTVMSTLTITPTATPTPIALFSPEGFRLNAPVIVPAVIVLIIVLVLGLIGLLLFSRRKQTSSAFINSGQTMAQMPVPVLPGSSSAPTPLNGMQVSGSPSSFNPNATNAVPYMDPSLTNMMPQAPLPDTWLTVRQSLNRGLVGTRKAITSVPFQIGRESGSLLIPDDKNVSRKHAEIQFEGGTFYVKDVNSQHGVEVDNQPVPKGGRLALHPNALITLGTTTVLLFEVNSPNGNAPDTNLTWMGNN